MSASQKLLQASGKSAPLELTLEGTFFVSNTDYQTMTISGHQAGDILLLGQLTYNNESAAATPTGFTYLSPFFVNAGNISGGAPHTQRINYKILDGTESTFNAFASGDYKYSAIAYLLRPSKPVTAVSVEYNPSNYFTAALDFTAINTPTISGDFPAVVFGAASSYFNATDPAIQGSYWTANNTDIPLSAAQYAFAIEIQDTATTRSVDTNGTCQYFKGLLMVGAITFST